MNPPTNPSATLPERQENRVVYCIALMAFTFQFDALLVLVALPDMVREFSTTSTGASLIVVSYLMAATVAFVPASKLCHRYSLRTLSLAGCFTGTAGTLLCAVSPTIEILYASRFLQGLGTGVMVAAGYAMMPTFIRQSRVGWGYGLQSLGAGMGMVTGIPAGGLLSEFLEWPWIFWATLPLFGLLTVFVWRVIPAANAVAVQRRHPIHWDALGLFCGIMVTLVFALSFGGEFGWTSRPILIAWSISAGLILAFFVLAKKGRRLFPAETFQSSSRLLALLSLFLFALFGSGVRYTLPFYLEVACGLSALASSLVLLTFPIGFGPAGIFAGRLSDRFGSIPLLVWSGLLSSLICLGFTGLIGFYSAALTSLFAFGFGVTSGLYFAPSNRYLVGTAPETLRAEMGGLIPLVMNFGTLMGVAVFEMTLTLGLSDGILRLQAPADGIPQAHASPNFVLNLLVAAGLCFLAAILAALVPRVSPAKHSLPH
jgi:MFS family permease